MKISIVNKQKDISIKCIKKAMHYLVPAVIMKEAKVQGWDHDTWDEVSFHFVTKKEIASLHDTFFNDPTSTDCITFPVDSYKAPRPRVLGEVFICPKVAIEYAQEHQTDPQQETLLYIVHGLLHLLGYDDIQPRDRKIMRQKEHIYMKLVSTNV